MKPRDATITAGTALAVALLAACAGGQRPVPQLASAVMPGAAQGGSGEGGNPVTLYGDLGPHARDVTTSSEKAQAYFNEGLLFMYAFGTSAAEESFRGAQHEDPECASCYWGEAWALSPYLNGGMSPGDERSAHAAMRKAKERLDGATEVERALIEAFDVRFEAEPDRSRRRTLDTLYAREMDEVAARFPDDLDVLTLQAEAWMLLRPRRGDVDLKADDVSKILPILETVLARDIRHPGACHLYIHLVESSPEPGLAEECSDHLGSQIAVSHIHHMPTHIYMNIGRWGDAVRGNQQAWHADQKADFGGPPGVYPSHNLHMLLNAAVMDGQSAVAMQAAQDLAGHRGPWGAYIPLTYAAFGRWSEILAGGGPTSDEPMELVAWSFSRGLAYLRMGHVQVARDHLAEIDEVLSNADPSANFRFSPLADVVALPRSILAGEILHAEGKTEEAIAVLGRGIEKEDGLVYSEPRAWHMPVRHTLGAILLEDGQAGEAERVYREALEDLPNQGWAWFGLTQALDAQRKTAQAQEARREFDRYWARADTWLRSSRF